ncbi:hypothetical protein PGTUg99_008575 [Puccinia graminis f. sp. tritici]|uniref:Uncharacterized protein n=1 Tax=Puccinia graminis f. sp. tritici TaxID=56615 RepID=A0A5B0RK22_PUCGR|nr:hypothetical protein PGTUg99_008575 [Puccinia graminis f. sp. tritici]
MVAGYPLRIPAIRWRIPPSANGYGFGCGWPLFPPNLADIRVSPGIPEAERRKVSGWKETAGITNPCP